MINDSYGSRSRLTEALAWHGPWSTIISGLGAMGVILLEGGRFILRGKLINKKITNVSCDESNERTRYEFFYNLQMQ